MKKVILITGTSSGMGLEAVKELSADGHIVYGTVRKEEEFSIVEAAGGKPILVEMTNYTTLENAVKKVIKEQGKIDVLYNNAGYGLYGTVEDVPIDVAKKQFDVNLFGLARLTQLVLPHMRKANSGLIINTSSMGGKIYTPLGAWYHATKHALEGWSDCLRLEMKQFNVNVVVIEPGGIQTPWGKTAYDSMLKYSGKSAYKEFAQKAAQTTRANYETDGRLSPSSVIIELVKKAISSKNPKPRYVAGKYARLTIFIRKWFGDRIYDRIVMSTMK